MAILILFGVMSLMTIAACIRIMMDDGRISRTPMVFVTVSVLVLIFIIVYISRKSADTRHGPLITIDQKVIE